MTIETLRYSGVLGYYYDQKAIPFALCIVGFVLCAIIAYFLGSLNFGVILSKLKYRDDVRVHGSGNAGMTNMLRTYGKSAAVATFAGDGVKAVVAILIGTVICGMIGSYLSGLFCVIGHIFPIFFGFKGGKGVVTAAFTALILDPLVFLILLVVFLVVVIFTKYVSLASIMCMLMYPMMLYNFTPNPNEKFKVIFAFIIAVLIIFMHRSNIMRLKQGKENKISIGKKNKKEKTSSAKTESAEASDKSEN